MKQQISSQSVTLVFMGDSITEGQYVSSKFRWTDLIVGRLRKRFVHTTMNIKSLNCGVSGQTTRQGLERFPKDVQNNLPDVMTLQFGLNDCNCWVSDRGLPRVSIEAYQANLVEMIDRARWFGAKHIILSTNHPTLRREPLSSGESLESARIRYNEALRKVARKTEVVLCDIDEGFAGLPDQAIETMLLPHPDRLHLSPEGHIRYADIIEPYIEAAIDEVLYSKWHGDEKIKY